MVLLLLILLPLLTIIFLLGLSEKTNLHLIKYLSLFSACFTFILSLGLVSFFNKLALNYQYLFYFDWFFSSKIYFGVDGISIFLILLVTFITFFCILVALRRKAGVKFMLIYIFLIEFFCLVVFSVLDLLVFYMFFESVLMPMFVMIGIWGSTYSGRVKAGYYFFLYTLAGSVLFLWAIIIFYLETGTTSMIVLLNIDFSIKKQLILFCFTFLGFAVKIPLFPLHIWLPEAHVEAPTEGSVILASVLLKLGGYGFLRVSIPMFPYASNYFSGYIYGLCTLGVIYASICTCRQFDLKKIIAYSSVAHMNFVVIGIFAMNHEGLEGSLFLMLGHGIISGGLFFLIGIVYDRHDTRCVDYYGGLAVPMPLYATIFLFFTLANMAFPGSCNFVGEILILVGLFKKNILLSFFAATGIVLSAAYSIWLLNRVIFGNLKVQHLEKYKDITRHEFYILAPLTLTGLYFGIFPGFVLDYTFISIANLHLFI